MVGQRIALAYRCLLRYAALLTALVATPLCAQDRPDPPKPVFERLFPKPTGRNGYEDLVMAADLARAADARIEITAPDIKLADLKEALKDPDRQRALVLVRRGITKPITSPRAQVGCTSELPELAGMRAVARLLAAHMRARFADGAAPEAVDDLRDGLALGSCLYGETLIGSMVAVACDLTLMHRFLLHIDQLSARDCDRALQFCRDWLKTPDPAPIALNAERRAILADLQRMRDDPAAARQKVDAALRDDGTEAVKQKYPEALEAHLRDPARLAALVDDVARRVNAFFDQQLVEAKKPVPERKKLDPEADDSLAGHFAGIMLPSVHAISNRIADLGAHVRELGVRLAIRRHLIETDRVPEALTDLKLGGMAIDPITGQPFAYKVTGPRTYEMKLENPDNTGLPRR